MAVGGRDVPDGLCVVHFRYGYTEPARARGRCGSCSDWTAPTGCPA